MPAWVTGGYQEYARRMPREFKLELTEISPGRRSAGGNTQRAVQEESERLLAAIPAQSHVVTLDKDGRCWTTEQLSHQIDRWMQGGQDVALLIGGADGLGEEVKARARQSWSLSRLIFPHGLVRVMVAEQLYRGISLLRGHPYHRA